MEAWRDELYHHGIKGQSWGVHNGPPYPLDNRVKQRIKEKEKKIRKTKRKKAAVDAGIMAGGVLSFAGLSVGYAGVIATNLPMMAVGLGVSAVSSILASSGDTTLNKLDRRIQKDTSDLSALKEYDSNPDWQKVGFELAHELYHHGIKGQQWGVRNGPPYPIENKVYKKGSVVASVTSQYGDPDKYKNTGRWLYTYNPKDEWDSTVYKGPFSEYLLEAGGKFVAEHQYELVKDLKMPTLKERKKEFKDLYDTDKDGDEVDVKGDIQLFKDYMLSSGRFPAVFDTTKYSWDDLEAMDAYDLKTEKDYDMAYILFNDAMQASYKYGSTNEYAKRISSKYDAMVDDHNVGTYNDAHDPVIIFNANNVLKSIGSVPVGSISEEFGGKGKITENVGKVDNRMEELGRNTVY